VAKPELGTKRLCAECGAKFYDLNKDPITCPKCSTVFVVAPVVTRGRPEPVAAPARAAAPVAEAVVPETPEAEFVSLEDADAEAEGGPKVPALEGEGEEEVELDETLDDAALIEEQEEGDADVTDIIGEREADEET
jgi:uncharacterized protein (TIGR02300 family)